MGAAQGLVGTVFAAAEAVLLQQQVGLVLLLLLLGLTPSLRV
jgi:hypothetical protein